MSGEASTWKSLDIESNQSLVLAAYRSGRISGTQAWNLFQDQGLWADKEDAFHKYVQGCEVFETQRELWRAPVAEKEKARRLIGRASMAGLISLASLEWLLTLVGPDDGDDLCGE